MITQISDNIIQAACSKCGAQIAVDLGELEPELRENALRLARFIVCNGCKSLSHRLASPQREIREPYRDD